MISFQTWKPCLFESWYQIKVLKPFLFIPLENIVRFTFEPRQDVHLPLQRKLMVFKQEKLSKIKKSALTLSLHLEVFCFFTLLCFCCLKTWRCERFAGYFSLEIIIYVHRYFTTFLLAFSSRKWNVGIEKEIKRRDTWKLGSVWMITNWFLFYFKRKDSQLHASFFLRDNPLQT